MSDLIPGKEMISLKEMTKSFQKFEEEIEADESSLASSEYDEELAERIIQIKRERNSVVPINQLPTEILIHIFDASIGTSSKRFKRLKTIAGVAWLWNSIVKRTPELWAVLDSRMSMKLLPLVLQRAGDFPLKIKLREEHWPRSKSDSDEEDRDADSRGFLDMLLPKLGRWKEASLILRSSQGDLLDRLEGPAPLLTKCYLEASKLRPPPQIDLFQGHAPSLTEMTLKGAPVRWSSIIFRNLRSVWIGGVKEDGPTVEDVLQSILSAPCLEHMSLIESTLSSSTLHQDIPPVEIPHLKSLNISGLSSSSTQLLLSHIRAPALYRLIVQPNQPDTTDNNHLVTFFNDSLLHFSPIIYSCISRSDCLYILVSRFTGTIKVSTAQDLDHGEGICLDLHHWPVMLGLQLCVELLLRNGLPRPPISLTLDSVDNIPESQLLWIFDSEINNAVTEVEVRTFFGGDTFIPFLCKGTYLRDVSLSR